MISLDRVRKNAGVMKSLTGLSAAEFDALLPTFSAMFREEVYSLFADIGEETNPGDRGVCTTALLDVFYPGKKLIFLFDYGDDWRFDVICQTIEETKSAFRRPKILNPKGKPPIQYPDYDEES